MPFGLQLKSILVGLLLAWFLIPWLQTLMGGFTGANRGD